MPCSPDLVFDGVPLAEGHRGAKSSIASSAGKSRGSESDTSRPVSLVQSDAFLH